MEKSKKKSNDNYGPKIKLFICVQAAHTSFLVAVPVFWEGGRETREAERKIYEEINCEKSPLRNFFQFYGLCIWWKRTHNAPKPAEKSNHPQSLSLSLFFFSLPHNFPFHFFRRSLCKTCVEKLCNGMRTKLKKFHPLQPPQLTNTSTHCRSSLKNNKNEKNLPHLSSPPTLPKFTSVCVDTGTNTPAKFFFGRLRIFSGPSGLTFFTYEAGKYSLTFLIFRSEKKKPRKGKSLISFLQHSKAQILNWTIRGL